MEYNRKNIIEEECMDFAIKIVTLSKDVARSKKEYKMTDQLLRAGTAVGALYGESHYAESDADYVHKIKISLKECHETQYWLELLTETHYVAEDVCAILYEQANSIHRLLTSCMRKAQEKIK